jgi:hypothetical protein
LVIDVVSAFLQDLLEAHLIPASKGESDFESEIFYLKMKGDYNRYLAEQVKDKDGKTAARIIPGHVKWWLTSEVATVVLCVMCLVALLSMIKE